MENEVLKNIYVGIDVDKSDELISFQEMLSKKLGLFLREDFHITIAYFDVISKENLVNLGNSLKSIFQEGLKDIKIDGLGGACEINNEVKSINSINSNDLLNYPRVLWWAVNQTDSLINFRNSLIAVSMTLNLSSSYLRPTFFPHITIGSGGNTKDDEKWKKWDTHSIEKIVTIKDCFYNKKETFNKLHITNSSIHPNSLFVIHE